MTTNKSTSNQYIIKVDMNTYDQIETIRDQLALADNSEAVKLISSMFLSREPRERHAAAEEFKPRIRIYKKCEYNIYGV